MIESGKQIEIRIPLIPNITDTDINLNNLINFISSLKIKPSVILLPYNPLNRDKLDRFCLENTFGKLKIQSKKKLLEIQQQFIDHGIIAILGE